MGQLLEGGHHRGAEGPTLGVVDNEHAVDLAVDRHGKGHRDGRPASAAGIPHYRWEGGAVAELGGSGSDGGTGGRDGLRRAVAAQNIRPAGNVGATRRDARHRAAGAIDERAVPGPGEAAFVDDHACLLYTSDAADEEDSVDLG